jgi:hypothetical protein
LLSPLTRSLSFGVLSEILGRSILDEGEDEGADEGIEGSGGVTFDVCFS